MPPKQRFVDGEKILCYHGPLIYKAECLKSDFSVENKVKYYVHYAGWNKNWDEWVPESRILKYTEANIAKQNELQARSTVNNIGTKTKRGRGRKSDNKADNKGDIKADHKADTKATAPPAAAIVTAAPSIKKRTVEVVAGPAKRKRGRPTPKVEPEEKYIRKIEIKMPMSDELKLWLVNDWVKIKLKLQLLNVPAKVTVDKIMDNYLMKRKTAKSNSRRRTLSFELSEGVKYYFNVIFASHLLYDLEIPQYQKILLQYPELRMSAIYGAIHLLRFFSMVGTMLSYFPFDEKSVHTLKLMHKDFLKYLIKNSATLLSSQVYIGVNNEYLKKFYHCASRSSKNRLRPVKR